MKFINIAKIFDKYEITPIKNYKFKDFKDLEAFENYLSNKKSLDDIVIEQPYIIIHYNNISFQDYFTDTLTYENIKKLTFLESLICPLTKIMFDEAYFDLTCIPAMKYFEEYNRQYPNLVNEFDRVYNLLKNICERKYGKFAFYFQQYISYKFEYQNFSCELNFDLKNLEQDLNNFKIIEPTLLTLNTLKKITN